MHLMTSLQLLLLLLSAHWQLEAFTFNDYDDVEDGGASNFNSTIERSAAKDETCESQKEIANWINDQVIKNAKLTSFNQRMGKLLDALYMKRPKEIGDENCCFYEKNAMDKIMADVTTLSINSEIAVNSPLEPSGDMGKDLDNILDRMRMLIGNETKTCCDLLTDKLQVMEADMIKELDNIKQQLSGKNKEHTGVRDQLKAKQAELEAKLRELTLRIDKLEKLQKQDKEEMTKCCKELNARVDELKVQLETAQDESQKKAKELQREFKKMQINQGAQETLIFKLQKDTAKRAKDIQDAIKKCEKAYALNQGNDTENEQNKRLEELEKLVKELMEQLTSLNTLSESLAQCQQFKDALQKVEDKMKELQAQIDANNQAKPDPNNCAANQELQHEIEMAKSCCKNTDKLTNDLAMLQLNVTVMGDNYKNHIVKLEANIKEMQDRLNEAMDKLSTMSTTTTPKPEIVMDSGLEERIKRLQAELNTANKFIVIIQKRLTDNDNKLSEMKETLSKKIDELEDKLADRQQASENLENLVEERLKELEAKLNAANDKPKPDVKILERLLNLEKEYEVLRKDTDKALQQEQIIDKLEQHIEEVFNKVKENEAKLGECTGKCDSFDKLNDLIDRVEDLEKLSAGTPTVSKGPNRKPKTTRRYIPSSNALGMIGSIDNPVKFYQRRRP